MSLRKQDIESIRSSVLHKLFNSFAGLPALVEHKKYHRDKSLVHSSLGDFSRLCNAKRGEIPTRRAKFSPALRATAHVQPTLLSVVGLDIIPCGSANWLSHDVTT